MPKLYTDCVKRNVEKGMLLKNAQRKCAIWYYKTFGKRPQDVEGAALSSFEEKLFNILEVLKAAKWTSKYRGNLPRGSYLYVDKEGKGHLPYKNKQGKIDCAHLRNAIARLGQPKTGTAEHEWLKESLASWLTPALRARLQAKARRLYAKHCKK